MKGLMTPNQAPIDRPAIRSFVLIMQNTILIAVAGLVGTLLRYWLSGYVAKQHGGTFPWGTIAVNLIGCLITGAVFFVTEERLVVSTTVRTMILIGLLGGFTTFSSYGLQTFTLLRDGDYGLALLNVIVSNTLGLFMVWLGYILSKVL
jgi:fluoride exporter